MDKVEKKRGLGGVFHGVESFIAGVTEKGLVLAEGSKSLQKNAPETYAAIKSARQVYQEYNTQLATGKAREVRGAAAGALAKVVSGLGKDSGTKIASMLSKINPFKKKAAVAASAVGVSKSR